MNKTLTLFNTYQKLLEQDEQDPSMQEQPPQEGMDVQDVTQPEPAEEMPLTSSGEDEYIARLVDAALFEPSPEDANTLMNLQSVMHLKKYTNAREEILPTLLSIINSESTGSTIRKELGQLD